MIELNNEDARELIARILREEKEKLYRIKDLKLELYELEQAGIHCDADRIKEIIDELEILDPYPEEFEFSPEEMQIQKEKTKAAMRESLKRQDKKEKIAKMKKFIKRFSTVAAVLIFVLTISTPVLGFNIFALIAKWGKEVFSFGSLPKTECFASTLEEPIYEEYDNLATAITAFKFPVTVPEWVPNGYKIEKIEVMHLPTDSHRFMIKYSNGDKVLDFNATVYHKGIEEATAALEKSQEDPLYFPYQGIEHHIMVNIGETTITWGKDDVIYRINGNLTVEEAQEMIKSLY